MNNTLPSKRRWRRRRPGSNYTLGQKLFAEEMRQLALEDQEAVREMFSQRRNGQPMGSIEVASGLGLQASALLPSGKNPRRR